MSEVVRSRKARSQAAGVLARIVEGYGSVPSFVVLGGLVPDLLCSQSKLRHAGTTDVDMQFNLELAHSSVNAPRLEAALLGAGLRPDAERPWRWHVEEGPGMVVKAEFLADVDDIPNERTVIFDSCERLGAVNLRGTSFAANDWEVAEVVGAIDGAVVSAQVRVARLAGYLLAKVHAARGRRASKDWYDIVYVLLYNDEGGPRAAGLKVRELLGKVPSGSTRTALVDLLGNFADPRAQGPTAYAETMLSIDSALDADLLVNDAIAAVEEFVAATEVR